MLNKITQIEILPEYVIRATFAAKVVKKYDFKKLIAGHPAFQQLKNPALFALAKIDCGGYGLAWTDEIDIDAAEIWYNGTAELRSDEDVCNYLQSISGEDKPEQIVKMLNEVAKFKGMSGLAQKMGVNRESLYKSLNGKNSPLFGTVCKALNALGFQLSVKPLKSEA